MNRRGFLTGLIAAPAVVAVGSLMPIRGLVMPSATLTVYVMAGRPLYTFVDGIMWEYRPKVDTWRRVTPGVDLWELTEGVVSRRGDR